MATHLKPVLEVAPDAHLEKRTRRRFSGAEKQRLLEEFELPGARIKPQGQGQMIFGLSVIFDHPLDLKPFR